MKQSTLIILAAFGTVLYLPSPAESNKCYNCFPCGDAVKDTELTLCVQRFQACAKFVSEDGIVYRGCISEQDKKNFDGICDLKLTDFLLGVPDVIGCIYGCNGDGCNSAPSTLMAGQWKIVLISLLASMSLVFL